MMDLTDRHCRAFLRLFSRHIRLYTEMRVTGSILFGDREGFLKYDEIEHPVILQLGGSDPEQLGKCAQFAEQWGYDEVNMNVGCPSDRVKNASFGACLMANPTLVADCVASMVDAVNISVTVKTRIGIDDMDSYEELVAFVDLVSKAGCQHFIVHARKAWLQGLSPKENRTIPPLHYDRVYKLKQDFPHLMFTINGGITDLDQAQTHLELLEGVMIGREAYFNPWVLHDIDSRVFGEPVDGLDSSPIQTRFDIVEAFLPYVESQLSQDIYLRHMTRHILGLFHGQPGAKRWRRYLSEHGPKHGAGLEVIEKALSFVSQEAEKEGGDAGNSDTSQDPSSQGCSSHRDSSRHVFLEKEDVGLAAAG